ncbi:MAG: MATE family efflux transporter [Clostridiaceae bacterium]
MQFDFLHQNAEERRNIILNGSIAPTILLLSIPTLMMGIVQSIIPVVDGLFINNFSGYIAASAISYSGPVINMTAALAQGLSVAAMAIIGQANGRGDFSEARKISTQIFVFAFFLGLMIAPILAAVSFPVSNHVNAEISKEVFKYIALSSLVLPFSFLESTYNAIKNASGKPEAAFIRMVLMLILKVIFNAIFIAGFRWGVTGTVAATLLSNILISIWMFHELFIKKSSERLILKGFKLDPGIIRDLFRVGIPSAISSLVLNLGFFLINNEVEKYGPIVMNGQGIAGNISTICYNLPSSFGSSVTTMVSMNVGAGQGDKARKSCITGCIVSAVTAAVIIAIVVPLSSYITVLFTRNTEVLGVANNALQIYTYSVIGFGVGMVQQGAFIGLGRTRVTLFASIMRIWFLRYVFIIITERWLGVNSVFWGNLFSNYMSAIITTIIIARTKWISALPNRSLETAP